MGGGATDVLRARLKGTGISLGMMKSRVKDPALCVGSVIVVVGAFFSVSRP